MITEMLTAIVEEGLDIVIAAIFLWIVLNYYLKLGPRIDQLDEHIAFKNSTIEELGRITDSNSNALAEVAQSNNNIALALKLLNSSIGNYNEIVKILLEDIRETQYCLDKHDDKVNNLYLLVNDLHVNTFGTPRQREQHRDVVVDTSDEE